MGGALYFDLSIFEEGTILISKMSASSEPTKFIENRSYLGGAIYFASTLMPVSIKLESIIF